MRRWDCDAARRPTAYIANSQITRERIARFWGRDAAVVHPPVDISRFRVGEPEDVLQQLALALLKHAASRRGSHEQADLVLRVRRLTRAAGRAEGTHDQASGAADRPNERTNKLGKREEGRSREQEDPQRRI